MVATEMVEAVQRGLGDASMELLAHQGRGCEEAGGV